jgi:hypothetical protein
MPSPSAPSSSAATLSGTPATAPRTPSTSTPRSPRPSWWARIWHRVNGSLPQQPRNRSPGRRLQHQRDRARSPRSRARRGRARAQSAGGEAVPRAHGLPVFEQPIEHADLPGAPLRQDPALAGPRAPARPGTRPRHGPARTTAGREAVRHRSERGKPWRQLFAETGLTGTCHSTSSTSRRSRWDSSSRNAASRSCSSAPSATESGY